MAGIVFRQLTGVLAGLVTGAAALALLAFAWPYRSRWAPRMVALERARLAAWFGQETDGSASGHGYLALRALVGVFGGYLALGLLFLALLFLGGSMWVVFSGEYAPVALDLPGIRLSMHSWAVGLACGVVLLALGAFWCRLLVATERRLAVRFLGPGQQELMRRRIAELTVTRYGIVPVRRRRAAQDRARPARRRTAARRGAGHAARAGPAQPRRGRRAGGSGVRRVAAAPRRAA